MCKYCDINPREFLGEYYNDKNYGESETDIADTRHEGCKIVLYHGNHVIVVRGNYEDFSEPISYCPFCGKKLKSNFLKYKIGDKVKLKSLNWYNDNADINGNVIRFDSEYGVDVFFTKNDAQYCGKIFTIKDICDNCYIFEEMDNPFGYLEEMIECKVE